MRSNSTREEWRLTSMLLGSRTTHFLHKQLLRPKASVMLKVITWTEQMWEPLWISLYQCRHGKDARQTLCLIIHSLLRRLCGFTLYWDLTATNLCTIQEIQMVLSLQLAQESGFNPLNGQSPLNGNLGPLMVKSQATSSSMITSGSQQFMVLGIWLLNGNAKTCRTWF